MITTTNVTHKASQCPRHPNVRIVREDVTKHSDTRLTEFFCAAGECNQPLGWNYVFRQGENTRITGGSGACRNPDVLGHQARVSHDSETGFQAAVDIMAAVGPAAAAAFTWNWGPVAAVVVAAGAAVSAGFAYNIAKRIRNRQAMPDITGAITREP